MQAGDKIPLFAATSDYSSSAFCRAFVTDVLGNPLIGSPVTMTPDSTGQYSNNTLVMPAGPWVHAKYVFYQDSGFTTLSTSQGQSNATFYLDSLKAGDKIPLFAATANYSSDQFCRAFLTDAAGNPLSGSPAALTPDSTGEYSNRTVLMPQSPWVQAKFIFYEDSGFTILSTSQGQSNALFFLQTAKNLFPAFTNITGVIEGMPCTSMPIQDTITQGSDRVLLVRLLRDSCGDPFDISAATLVEFRFRNQDGTVLSLKTTDAGPPVTIVSGPAGSLSCMLSKTQTALLATQIPAPFSVIVTLPGGVTVVNFPTQLAVEEQDV